MAWEIFKKIGEGFKKAFHWVKDKVAKPVAKVLSHIAKQIDGVVKTLLPSVAPIVDITEAAIDKLGQRP